MKLYTVLKMTNIEYFVKSVINSVSKDIIKNILNQEVRQVISIKDRIKTFFFQLIFSLTNVCFCLDSCNNSVNYEYLIYENDRCFNNEKKIKNRITLK